MDVIASIRKVLTWRLFSRSVEATGALAIIKWWEFRRIPFNLIVGATGVVTWLVIAAAAYMATPAVGAEPDDFPESFGVIFGVIAYGILANVCFTGGWVAEIVAKRIWEKEIGAIAQITFFLGLVFSVLLTLLPGALFLGMWVLRSLLR